MTFIAWLIQVLDYKWENVYKKKSFLVMSIASFLQLWTTNNWKTLKNQKNQKSHFSDFYCMIYTKFWTTNKKMLIKKSLLVTFISLFLQLWTTNESKNIQKSKKSLLVTFIAWFKSWFKSLDLNQANPGAFK